MKITGSSGDRERIAIFVPNGRDMEEFIKKMREAYPVSDGALQLFLRLIIFDHCTPGKASVSVINFYIIGIFIF